MLDKIKKDKFLWGLAIIVLLAFVVRVWMFSDLLTFKMDQSRDIKLIEDAYSEGVGELPLLGPRAAKTYLRLGPVAYYFEYVALLIFGDNPWAMAVPDFIFSILTIPLFYYFLRQVFSKKISLMTTAVFASSFFLVQYGRFAWNPNAIPFWSLLYFLGLYKMVASHPLKTNPKRLVRPGWKSQMKGRWLLVAVIGYGVASQLHFTAMLAYPLIGALFIFASLFIRGSLSVTDVMGDIKSQKSKVKSQNNIINQSIDYLTIIVGQMIKEIWIFVKSIGWKYWLGAVVILGIFYLPMFLSEVCTHGDNWLQFKYALSGRGKEEFTLYAKIIQSLKLHSEYFWFSLTSLEKGGSNFGVLGFFVLVLFAIFSWGKKLKVIPFRMSYAGQESQKSKVNNNSQRNRNIFFLLIFIWWVVMFALYTKLAFNVLKPRYWLLEVPIFFVILATLIEQSINWFKHQGKTSVLVMALVGGIVGMNLWATGYWYWSVQNQQEGKVFHWKLKLKDENKIPWGQLNKAANYLIELSEQTDKDVCFYTTGEYRPVYDYIFERRGLSEKIRRMSFGSDSNEKCLFIGIDHNKKREIPRIPKRHKDEFEKVVDGKKEIGFVTVWEVNRKSKVESLKSDVVTTWATSQEEKDQKLQVIEKKEMNGRANVKGQTSKVVGNENSTVNKKNKEINNNKSEEKVKKPKRVERVRWKDVWSCWFGR